MSTILKHKEQQYFDDKLAVALLLSASVGTAVAAVFSLLNTSTSEGYAVAYALLSLGCAGALYYLRRLRLKVSINEKRIKYKLKPLHQKARKIVWDDVASCRIVKTPKMAQWHGSNISYGNENFVSLAGRNGLAIETKDGRRHFIGCEQTDKLGHMLTRFRR